jgi:hypothetical protein
MTRIVGWHLEPSAGWLCECGEPATVIVSVGNGYDYYECCSACVPTGTEDEIAEIFAKAIARQTETTQQ